MSLDFALKDFYRKRAQTYPYVLTISIVIAFAEFLIYFTNSLGLNFFIENEIFGGRTINNEFYFSGSLNLIYTQFNILIVALVLILSFIIVVVITTTLIITKKRDIAIMKALGTLPGKLYGFYLLEAFIIFIVSFITGLIMGLIAFGIFAMIMTLLGYSVLIFIDIFYTPILFFSCLVGIFFITGFQLRKIGRENIIKTFSKDIPYNYDASIPLRFIPKWLSNFSYNLKIATLNTLRKKGEFQRYLLIFIVLFLIIFTLGLGNIVLSNSSQEWIQKSQDDNIIVFGHKSVVENYILMYEMFSNPKLSIDENDIDFMRNDYIFNFSLISEELNNLNEIEVVDERLIQFCDIIEKDGIHYYQDEDEPSGGYITIGQDRKGNIPIIALNPENMIQDFELEGRFFSEKDAFDNMTIGDGLAYNFFDYALDQSLELTTIGHIYHISGIIIDSFYSGYAGYVDLNETRNDLELKGTEVNLVLIKIKDLLNNNLEKELDNIKEKLGEDFIYKSLKDVFDMNISYVRNISLYPAFLILMLTVISVISLYNYQKAGLIEKAKDFLIMRAIGSKNKSIKRILFLETFFIIVPAISIALSISMILNSIVLFDRVYLPPLFVPFMVAGSLFGAILILNYLSLIPIMKKINSFNVKDFEIY
ncbi:MAG: FtsX-like permease family protein [Promethearchaeota archaeon]